MVKSLWRGTALAGLIAMGMSVLAGGAQAYPSLPNLTNLNFLSYTGTAPKAPFTSVQPTGWVGGGNLIFIDQPGNASNPNSACGGIYLQTYGCPSTLNIPGGYNYVEADGNPDYEGSFSYMIHGLVTGQTYTLSFYQAGSQQTGFANGQPTTEQWIVSLGTAGITVHTGGGPTDPIYGPTGSYTNSDPNADVQLTPLMTTPPGSMTDWQFVSLDLTADAPDQLLSFLAWGDKGSTINLPPIVFLAGVNSESGLNNVPEPATLSLFGLGIVAAGGLVRRRLKRA